MTHDPWRRAIEQRSRGLQDLRNAHSGTPGMDSGELIPIPSVHGSFPSCASHAFERATCEREPETSASQHCLTRNEPLIQRPTADKEGRISFERVLVLNPLDRAE